MGENRPGVFDEISSLKISSSGSWTLSAFHSFKMMMVLVGWSVVEGWNFSLHCDPVCEDNLG
jgi:hypothetical protein